MSDSTIEPRIMASSTVRPTLVVVPSMGRPSGHTQELTPGISTVEDVAAVVVGMTAKAATKLLEPRGYVVRAVSVDEQHESLARGTNAECVNLTLVEGKVSHVAFG
jgi:hypothetical protein